MSRLQARWPSWLMTTLEISSRRINAAERYTSRSRMLQIMTISQRCRILLRKVVDEHYKVYVHPQIQRAWLNQFFCHRYRLLCGARVIKFNWSTPGGCWRPNVLEDINECEACKCTTLMCSGVLADILRISPCMKEWWSLSVPGLSEKRQPKTTYETLFCGHTCNTLAVLTLLGTKLWDALKTMLTFAKTYEQEYGYRFSLAKTEGAAADLKNTSALLEVVFVHEHRIIPCRRLYCNVLQQRSSFRVKLCSYL